ncbi:hypothetical protein [Methylobacterium oryzae]|uniref:hypothetical protein n=1 Tax=Methylobacterium oryzae TaxID=334852 RepID=UPI001F18C495|nr:hypothetical protein [Methylobacterium oryzae]UIN38410.1 hypothetical protein LXM90_30980 [Methylobacterium oryzae]
MWNALGRIWDTIREIWDIFWRSYYPAVLGIILAIAIPMGILAYRAYQKGHPPMPCEATIAGCPEKP